MNYPIYLGCTTAQHKRIGIHAVVNARAGRQDLNQSEGENPQEMDMWRDSWKVRDYLANRVTIHQFNSRWFRRRLKRLIQPWSE